MRFTTIDELKKQARIDSDEEDDLLAMYCASAEDTVLNVINRTYEEVIEEHGVVPVALRHAALMLATYNYNKREPEAGQGSLAPDILEVLLKPYMRL